MKGAISVIDVAFEPIVNSTAKEFTMPVLHGAPIEHDVCTEWYTVEDLSQFQVTSVTIVFKWKPIFQWIGTLMPYCQRQYISLR